MQSLILLTVALAFAATPAFAQAASDTTVTIPYGQLVGEVATAALLALGGAITYAFRFIPAHLRWIVSVAKIDQLLEKALAKARAEITESITPKEWTVDVKNKMVANALQYAIGHFPSMIDQMGGIDKAREKLQARLQEWIERQF